jgi:DNA-binding NtrC family response regulator
MRRTTPDLKTSVLIIDGDPWQREVLAAALAYEGYHSEPVGDAASALAMLTRQRYQVVLLDPSAPSTGGWETVEKLVLLHPDLPVIVFASGEGASHSAALRGARDIIARPINFSTLRDALKRALELPAETFVVHCFEREQPDTRPAVGRGSGAWGLLDR